jgi:NADPH:quinone reductase-like Zn-dependent oxidoreductase
MHYILHFRALTTKNRATVVNARVTRGHTVLITGIGGGVALLALKLCVALGARVYVTSSSDAKIARAVALGAAGGVNYTHSQYGFSLPWRVFHPACTMTFCTSD